MPATFLDLLPSGPHAALTLPSGEVTTYDTLKRQAEHAAGWLRARFAPGERLLILQPVHPALYIALLAIFAADLTAVVVDPGLGWKTVWKIVERVKVRGLIGPAKLAPARLLPPLWGVKAHLSPDDSWACHTLSALTGAYEPLPFSPDHPALMTFTSGSTGLPKAMVRSHRLLWAQREALRHHLDLSPDDTELATLPVFVLNSLSRGVRVVVADADLRRPGSVDPARVIPQLERHKVTCISGSPAFLQPVAAALQAAGRTLPLRAAWTGGARVPSATAASLCAAFPAAKVEIVYGSSEAEPIAGLAVQTAGLQGFAGAQEGLRCMAEGEATGRGALVGVPVPECGVRVVEPGTLKEVPEGETGEIVVSGEHVNPAYWEDPAATARTKLREGDQIWHRTGDAGRWGAGVAGARSLWLQGRVGEDVGGVWPFPVEAAAEAVPGVTRAALIAWGDTALLCYQGTAPLAAVAASATRAAGRALTIRALPSIPVDARHNAKINRPALREWLSKNP